MPREERDETLRPGPSLPNMPMPGPMGYWPAGQPGGMPSGADQQQQPPLSGQLQQPSQSQQYPQVMSMPPRPGMAMDPSMMQVRLLWLCVILLVPALKGLSRTRRYCWS